MRQDARVRGRDALTGGQFPTCRDVCLWCWICRVKDKASRLTYSGGVPLLQDRAISIRIIAWYITKYGRLTYMPGTLELGSGLVFSGRLLFGNGKRIMIVVPCCDCGRVIELIVSV